MTTPIDSQRTLESILPIYFAHRPSMKDLTRLEYEIAIRKLDKFNGAPTIVADLSDEFVVQFMGWMVQGHKLAVATANGKRKVILAIWRFCRKRKWIDTLPEDVPKLKEPKRIPIATRPGDFEKILAHVDAGLPKRFCESRRLWTAQHWRAMLLCLYDTGCRLNPMLTIPRTCYSPGQRTLLIPGEFHKDGDDTLHRLSDQTCIEIDKLPRHPEHLFHWPRNRREIWRYYRRILAAAGVPLTRKHMFHSIRKLSYSLVYKEQGLVGAMAHCGHSENLSGRYLDPVVAGISTGLDALPRPILQRPKIDEAARPD